MNVSLSITLSFLLFALFLGVWAHRGKQMDMEQWCVGGRKFGPVFIFVLLAGEIFTTFTFLGASGMAYGIGIPAIYAFNVFYFVVAYWLLPPIWKYAKENKIQSQAEFYTCKYQSPTLGVVVSIISVIAVIPYMSIQFTGLGIIVSATSSGAISSSMAVIIGAVVVTIYVMISGIHGSAWTAFMKDILILGVMLFMGFYFPYHYYGGVGPMFKAIDAADPNLLLFPGSGKSISWFITTTIMLGGSFYMMPHMQNSVYSSKNSKSIRFSAALMPLYQLVIVFSLIVGFAAILQLPNLDQSQSDLALFKLVGASFDPWFVGIIGAAGALAALVPSSLVLMTTATIITNNIYKPLRPGTPAKSLETMSRALVPIIAATAVYFTINESQMIAIVYIMAYSIVAQLFPAMLFSLWKKNPLTTHGALAGMTVGVAMVAAANLTDTDLGTLFPDLPQFIKDMDTGLIIMCVNTMLSLGLSMIVRKAGLDAKATKPSRPDHREAIEAPARPLANSDAGRVRKRATAYASPFKLQPRISRIDHDIK